MGSRTTGIRDALAAAMDKDSRLELGVGVSDWWENSD